MMNKLIIIAVLPLLLMLPGDGYPRGGRGGGGGGGARPGGGGGGQSPSFGGGGGARPERSDPPSGGRSGMVPQQRPANTPGQRPDGNRPADRPATGANPDGNRTVNRSNDIGNRNVNVEGGNRPAYPWGNQPNVNAGNRTNVNNVGNRTNVNNYRPVYGYHNGWHSGYWNYWNYHPVAWTGGAAALGWMATGPTYVYSNPYYDSSSTTQIYNYADPLPPPPPPPTDAPPAPASDEPPPAPAPPADVDQNFTAARDAFKRGDYKKALDLVDKAIAKLPSDAVLHEFRALVLFALKNYRDAASTIYAVLAVGPGWDWETMKSLYPDVKTYTEQLRALETYQSDHPKAPEASFLLAYHYLTLGYKDDAAKQLANVVKLQPDDKVSEQLLKALKPASADEPPPRPQSEK